MHANTTATTPVRRVATLCATALVAIGVSSCSLLPGGLGGTTPPEPQATESEVTMAEWAPETDVEAGELLTTFAADGVEVEVYQVGVIPSPADAGRDVDDEPLLRKGDEVAVLNLVMTNTGDPIDITFIRTEPLAYVGDEPVDVQTVSSADSGEALAEFGLSPDWATVNYDAEQSVTFESNTRTALALLVEYVPDADMFVKVAFPTVTVAEEAELLPHP